jgi:predicted enzyme related to lactoylglutathione lyase
MSGRVTGIGGLFFRSDNPDALAAWYKAHFGIPGAMDGPPWQTDAGGTVFAPFADDSDYFRKDRRFMFNLRVSGIGEIIERLTLAGVAVKRLDDETYGIFAHLEDPEGNPIELWQPPA